MKSTIKISISGIAFNLENDAYVRLQSYLERIEKTFTNKDEGREIIEDIEVRIAELFSARIQSADQIITLATVNEVLGIIGSAEDIAGDDEQSTPQQASLQSKADEPTKKRLYRDIDHRVIGGVCSGLGNYFGIDRVVVRLIFLSAFILLPFFAKLNLFGFWHPNFSGVSGTSLLIYIILWIAMPAARTMKEKMIMRNEPITPSLDFYDSERDAHRNDFGNVLGRIVGGFLRVILWCIVGFCAFIALILIVSLPIALVTGNAEFGNLGYINLTEILQPYTYIPAWLVGLLIMFIICIPLVGATYGIFSLLFRFKSKIRVGLILFLTWLASLIALVGITAYVASDSNDFPEKLFSQKNTTYDYIEERPLAPFSKLSLKGNLEIMFVKSDTNYICIESKERFRGHININTDSEWLTITTSDFYRKKWSKIGRSKLTIYANELKKLDLSGGVLFACQDTLKPAAFDAKATGATKINLLLKTQKAKFDLTGAAKLNVAGTTGYAEFESSGATKINAFDFVADTVNIDVSGAGKMDVSATNYLKVEASGAAKIQYTGSPTMDIDKKGAVKISKLTD